MFAMADMGVDTVGISFFGEVSYDRPMAHDKIGNIIFICRVCPERF
jgi:hypothetical protein